MATTVIQKSSIKMDSGFSAKGDGSGAVAIVTPSASQYAIVTIASPAVVGGLSLGGNTVDIPAGVSTFYIAPTYAFAFRSAATAASVAMVVIFTNS